MDERQRVIRDLLQRLAEAGISPDRPFSADWVPGLGWAFSQEGRELSSSAAGVPEGANAQTQVRVPTKR